jgi:membrane-bound inhibitor of C-type lysozyme
MARPGNNDMSRRRNQFVTMNKSDFVFEVERMGMTVRQERVVRDGWNNSRATFVVAADGSEVMVSDAMKNDRVDWNDCFDQAMKFAR